MITRLERVRKSGNGFAARCPAHRDRSPSLSVTYGTDGRILIYCHAGCSVTDVVHALGMSMRDLFPQDVSTSALKHPRQGASRPPTLNWQWLLADCYVVLVAAGDLFRGHQLSEPDHERLSIAVERISLALAAIGGRQ
ncbi:MAG: hypothetical protein KDI60_04850 [Xanthomonadales bacterium]|nr:hypothetical protein [Xanthomonadales bacterium]